MGSSNGRYILECHAVLNVCLLLLNLGWDNNFDKNKLKVKQILIQMESFPPNLKANF